MHVQQGLERKKRTGMALVGCPDSGAFAASVSYFSFGVMVGSGRLW
jgi:chromosome condensin MukBEF MukE localization factor